MTVRSLLILFALGTLWPLLPKPGLFRQPGDILVARDDFRLYLPLTTPLIISVVLSILVRLLNR
jgi:hypothetical protein